MAILTPYILCALFLAVLYGLMRLALHFSSRAAYRSVLQSGIFTPKTIRTLFLAAFGGKNLLSGVFLPSELSERGFERMDDLLFLDGAIVIVSFYRDGETVSATRKKEALHEAFRRAGFQKRLPVEHIFILPTRKKGTPRPAAQELLSAPDAMKKLRAVGKPRRFDRKAKKALKKAIEAARLSPRELRTKASKTRRGKP